MKWTLFNKSNKSIDNKNIHIIKNIANIKKYLLYLNIIYYTVLFIKFQVILLQKSGSYHLIATT